MSKPDSRDQLTVPTFERNGASKPQRQSESTPPTKLRSVSNEEKSLEGTTLDKRFRVLERIGAGGMSEVYKAEHIMLQKMVAIKVLHKQQELEGIERFQQEAKAISALDHRNIVKVYAFGANEDDRLYLAMDFLQGKSLADILEEETRLSWRRAREYAIQIAEGLEQAHNRGIIHRDLKPSNIIIETDEYNNHIVKVVDFGIAKLTKESGKEVKNLTQDGNTCGSPPYMSPEQCLGERADARSDVYSFGIMMYELLTGVRPITGRTALEMMTNHLDQTPEFFERVCPDAQIPNSLEAIVRKCLEKDSNNRYQTMVDIQKALKLVGSSSDEESELESTNQKALITTKELERKQRTKRILIAAIAGAALAATCSALAFFVYLPQKELQDLKASVESLNLQDPKNIDRMKLVVPSLLDKFEKNQDKASGISVIRKLKRRVDAQPDSINKWLVLSQLSDYYLRCGLDAEAALLVDRSIGGLHILGETLRDQGNYAESELALQHCIALCNNHDKPATLKLQVLNLLFTSYMHHVNYPKAEHTGRNAILLANEAGNELERCTAYFNFGNALYYRNKLVDAETAYRNSWEHCLKQFTVDSELSKNIATMLAKTLRAQNKSEEALAVLNQVK